MNPIDDKLNRLFRAAGGKPAPEMAAPPLGLEARAMAAWREGRTDDSLWNRAILVRGLMVAVVIMGVCSWPALTATTKATDPFSDYIQIQMADTYTTDGTP